jgi:hypothetical protein
LINFPLIPAIHITKPIAYSGVHPRTECRPMSVLELNTYGNSMGRSYTIFSRLIVVIRGYRNTSWPIMKIIIMDSNPGILGIFLNPNIPGFGGSNPRISESKISNISM